MVKEFERVDSYNVFRSTVVNEFRYRLTPSAERFLNAVKYTVTSRIIEIDENSGVYRAQGGYDTQPHWSCNDPEDEPQHVSDELVPYSEQRMRPLKDSAQEGRANAKGMPVLYVASEWETAVAEARPWNGAFLSVAEFRVVRPLRIVNCVDNSLEPLSTGKYIGYLLKDPGSKTRNKVVWHRIDEAFAEPVTKTDHKADYAPTQILAELFRKLGYDGVMYKSSVAEGLNLALFDLASVELNWTKLARVTRLKIESELLDSPVF